MTKRNQSGKGMALSKPMTITKISRLYNTPSGNPRFQIMVEGGVAPLRVDGDCQLSLELAGTPHSEYIGKSFHIAHIGGVVHGLVEDTQ